MCKSRRNAQDPGRIKCSQNEAEYDSLTGLYNRKGFQRRAKAFLEQKEKRGALLLFDLDNFKQVNDREGHPAGDRLLAGFARCLRETFRREDVIGRLGGDEFVALIQSPVSAGTLEEKFRTLSGKLRASFPESSKKYRLCVSAGAVLADGSVRDYEELYACADTALYIAKYQGKGRLYLNEKKIRCMRRECIGCRADCPRSRILNGEGR